MLRQHHREKELNAIIFFVQNTKHCGKTKLYKLLYFLDFEHFALVGRSVTGLNYYAWPKGPVPKDLHKEIDNPPPDMAQAMGIQTRQLPNGHEMLSIKPKAGFDSTHFSKRELKLMEQLAQKYRTSRAGSMVEATHLENLPWHQVYEVQENKQGLIPYNLALRKAELEQIRKSVREHEEFVGNYG